VPCNVVTYLHEALLQSFADKNFKQRFYFEIKVEQFSILNLSFCVHPTLLRYKQWSDRTLEERVCLCHSIFLGLYVCDFFKEVLCLYVDVLPARNRW
jgi:hypothetical protein